MTIEHEFIKKLAKKYGLTIKQVEDIVYSQHRFVAHVMKNEADRESLDYPSVRLMGFGIFYCPDKVMHQLKKQKDESV